MNAIYSKPQDSTEIRILRSILPCATAATTNKRLRTLTIPFGNILNVADHKVFFTCFMTELICEMCTVYNLLQFHPVHVRVRLYAAHFWT